MMLSHDERLKLVMVDDGATREFTWKELFPSVFDRNAKFKPVFSCLGNEGGNDRIEIRWGNGPYVGDGLVAMITINTADPEERDIDVIEDHMSRIWARDRAAFRVAYSVARELAAGRLLPAHIPVNHISYVVVTGVEGVAIDPSRHHVLEAA